MSNDNQPAILIVRDGSPIPADLATEDAAFLPGWREVRNFDNYTLRRKIAGTSWSFLHLRGGKETRVMGRARRELLRRGVAQILAELNGRNFNSLEITVRVSKSFLGIIFLNIAVNLRHFQCNTAV